MPNSPWTGRVPFIRNGEPVDQNVANRPLETLAGRDQYLKDRLDAASLGQAVVAYGATLASNVLEGQPVAWNKQTQRFEQALADAVVDTTSGMYVPGLLADVIGVVSYKSAATKGDVVIAGRFPTDMDNAVDDTPAPGRYYLSSSAPGKLVLQRPPVSVPVLWWDGTYAYVAPSIRSFVEEHIHYRFYLVARPAGVNGDDGERVLISDPDPSLPGWLPASHASFNGRAPTGAAFGYNLAAHPALETHWPPTPVESVVVVVDRGIGNLGGTVAANGLSGLVYADRFGIWWMSDCIGDAPWPDDYDPDSPPLPVSANSSAGPECPRDEDMKITLFSTSMLFLTDRSCVTHLEPAVGSPLRFRDCTGADATAGALFADLELDFTSGGDDAEGSLAFKELNGDVFTRGRVVEGIFAGANIELASDHTLTVDGETMYQGRITANVTSDLVDRALPPQVTKLDAAREVPYGLVPYIGFPAARLAAISMRMNVPAAGIPEPSVVRIRALILGTAAGTLPLLTAVRMLIARPSGSAITLPIVTTALVFPSNVTVGANQYVEVSSDPITVAAGDTLFVKLTRSASDGYSGEVGLIRVEAILSAS